MKKIRHFQIFLHHHPKNIPKPVAVEKQAIVDAAAALYCHNITKFSRNAKKTTATLGNSRRIFETYFKELCKEVIPQ